MLQILRAPNWFIDMYATYKAWPPVMTRILQYALSADTS